MKTKTRNKSVPEKAEPAPKAVDSRLVELFVFRPRRNVPEYMVTLTEPTLEEGVLVCGDLGQTICREGTIQLLGGLNLLPNGTEYLRVKLTITALSLCVPKTEVTAHNMLDQATFEKLWAESEDMG